MILIAILLWSIALYIIIDRHVLLSHSLLKFSLSFILSIAILSFLFFLSLPLGIPFFIFQSLCFIIPLILIIVNFYSFKSVFKSLIAKKEKIPNSYLVIILSCISIFTLIFFFNIERWGNWDAWAIWTLHAKFLASDAEFINLFTNDLNWTHPDYPLMLSSLIAVIWKSFGSNSAMVPLFISFFTSLTLLATLTASFFEIKNLKLGVTTLIIATSSILLFTYGSYQYSDTLLSTFILIPIVLNHHLKKEKPIPFLLLLGFFTATCGWIKNEGIAFFVLFSVLFIISNFKNKRYLFYYMLGALIPILIIAFFKLKYAPANDLIELTSINSINKLIDLDRYITIFDFTLSYIIYKNPLLILLLISIIAIDYKYYLSFDFKVLIGLVFIYFLIYILTPKDLEWHLRTSIERVFHHISPALIYSMFFFFNKKYELSVKRKRND